MTLNAKNLEALESAKIAELLIEVSTGNAIAQRRLHLELAGNAGPDEAAREIGKRLAAICRSKTYVGWEEVKPLVDLTAQGNALQYLPRFRHGESGAHRTSACGLFTGAEPDVAPPQPRHRFVTYGKIVEKVRLASRL